MSINRYKPHIKIDKTKNLKRSKRPLRLKLNFIPKKKNGFSLVDGTLNATFFYINERKLNDIINIIILFIDGSQPLRLTG